MIPHLEGQIQRKKLLHGRIIGERKRIFGVQVRTKGSRRQKVLVHDVYEGSEAVEAVVGRSSRGISTNSRFLALTNRNDRLSRHQAEFIQEQGDEPSFEKCPQGAQLVD